jgi:hypothetical protein
MSVKVSWSSKHNKPCEVRADECLQQFMNCRQDWSA